MGWEWALNLLTDVFIKVKGRTCRKIDKGDLDS